ncbi:hypothetical protein PCASD_17998 [Puccinia coronata f. sp. avenae]|uniref:Uncharacterized protein n=1 Tax=Puccinia coronata f. sp. avenae TaxID=200324 RepID=A0A2N5U6H8_9BASI|nr:hypothetical protein PCASD_17998 [Puccinia coronata f. sp. avenae]
MASRVAAASAVSVCVVRPGGSTEGVRDADVDPAGVVNGMPRLALAAELGSCMLDGGGGDGSLGGDPMGERGSGRQAASRASASAAWRAAIRWTRRCSAQDARSMASGSVMGTLMPGLVLLVLMKLAGTARIACAPEQLSVWTLVEHVPPAAVICLIVPGHGVTKECDGNERCEHPWAETAGLHGSSRSNNDERGNRADGRQGVINRMDGQQQWMTHSQQQQATERETQRRHEAHRNLKFCEPKSKTNKS